MTFVVGLTTLTSYVSVSLQNQTMTHFLGLKIDRHSHLLIVLAGRWIPAGTGCSSGRQHDSSLCTDQRSVVHTYLMLMLKRYCGLLFLCPNKPSWSFFVFVFLSLSVCRAGPGCWPHQSDLTIDIDLLPRLWIWFCNLCPLEADTLLQLYHSAVLVGADTMCTTTS